MSEKDWIKLVIEHRHKFYFHTPSGDLIYKCSHGINSLCPTEITRKDLDLGLSLILNIQHYRMQRSKIVLSSFLGVFHEDLLCDVEQLEGFKSKIDYPYPLNALDIEIGCIGTIRLICVDDYELKFSISDKTFYRFLLIETKEVLYKTEDFIVPEIVNILNIESSKRM